MTQPVSPTSPAAPDRNGARKVYQASTGRRIAFSFIVLLLLPFFVSLVPMLLMRVRSGLWHDLPGFAMIAVALTLLFGLVVAELIRSLRTRISLGETAVHLTVPNGRGPTPFLRYASHRIPYGDIAHVETRREIYGGVMAPVLLKGARILTKDGRSIRLGYVNEENVDPTFPIPEIARQIAERAGVAVEDVGSVRRSASAKMLGFKSPDPAAATPVDQNEIARLNSAHRRFMTGLIALLVVLVGVGLAVDLMEPQARARASREAAPQKAPPAPVKK